MSRRKFNFLLLVSGVFFTSCISTHMMKSSLNDKITLIDGDTVISATLGDKDLNVKTDDISRYHWIKGFKLYTTQGAYTGRLLNGEYITKLRDGNLIEKGSFNKGLKDGKWYEWYNTGKLKTISHWKKGIQDGSYIEYYSNGNLKKKGEMSKGCVHGKWLIGDQTGNVVKERYKNGNVVVKEESTKQKDKKAEKSKFRLWDFFKKKDKDARQKDRQDIIDYKKNPSDKSIKKKTNSPGNEKKNSREKKNKKEKQRKSKRDKS